MIAMLFSFFTLQTNSLQVVIASDGEAAFVFFIYSNIEWGIANIGFNAGDGVRSFMVPGALTAQTTNIDMGSNVNISGLYVYRVDHNEVFEPTGEPTYSPHDFVKLPD